MSVIGKRKLYVSCLLLCALLLTACRNAEADTPTAELPANTADKVWLLEETYTETSEKTLKPTGVDVGNTDTEDLEYLATLVDTVNDNEGVAVTAVTPVDSDDNLNRDKELDTAISVVTSLPEADNQEHVRPEVTGSGVSLPERQLVYMVRRGNIERNLTAAINEERLKVDLAVYKENEEHEKALFEQASYNLQYLLPENFGKSSVYVISFTYQSQQELSERELESYFKNKLLDERENRILMLGDGMDELSLVLLASKREGDAYPYHYLLMILPWQSGADAKFALQYTEAQVELVDELNK